MLTCATILVLIGCGSLYLCCSCGYTHEDSWDGREFLCNKCGYTYHTDYNADSNIEAVGLEKLGPNTCNGQLKLRNVILSDHTGSAHYARGLWTWRVLALTPLRNVKHSPENHVWSFSGVTCDVLQVREHP